MRKILSFIFIAFVSISLLSCATTVKNTTSKATLTKTDSRMFWKIEGFDKNGKASAVYIQGTIHFGNEELYPLSETVLDAFDNANRLAGEISSEDMENLIVSIQMEALNSYKRANGKKVSDYLTEEENEFIISALGKETAKTIFSFEPWLLTQALSGLAYQSSNLDPNKGLDVILMERANKQNKKIEGLDTLETQIEILSFGNYDEQLKILKDTIKELKTGEGKEDIDNLYKAYLDSNLEEFFTLSNKEYETMSKEEKDFSERFSKTLLDNRNKQWAKIITNYLNEGGSTFIFAGAAHFIGDNSVFEYLKKLNTL